MLSLVQLGSVYAKHFCFEKSGAKQNYLLPTCSYPKEKNIKTYKNPNKKFEKKMSA